MKWAVPSGRRYGKRRHRSKNEKTGGITMGGFQPAIIKHGAGSCILVEGKPNQDRFYIIHEGKVRIIRNVDGILQSENDGKVNMAGPGDLFGVVSAMSSHSCIETVMAVTGLTLLVIERRQYVDLIRSKPSIAMKIIQQFSQRLRSLNEMLSVRALNKALNSDYSLLLQIANYYVQEGRYNQAFYVLQRYVKLNPGAPDLDTVKAEMKKIAPRVTVLRPVYAPDITECVYPKGSLLFTEGEPGNELYIIQSGSVKISKIMDNQEIVLAVLKTGDILGEMALLEDKPRTATAEVIEECTAVALNRANFEEKIRTNPEIIARLTALLAERIWLMYRQLANTDIENPLGRIYDALLIQLEKDHVDMKTNQKHCCNFGFRELAGMAGLSRAESEDLFKKVLLTKRIYLSGDKIFVTDASDVLRQAEYYRRAQKIGMKRGDAG
jgi:CRP-like cAMP-binding protein